MTSSLLVTTEREVRTIAIDRPSASNALRVSDKVVLAAAIREAETDGVRAIVLSFAGLEYMNSGGIGLLVTLLVRAQRQRQRVLAYGLSDHYRQIFELTRLDEAVGIHDGEDDALAALR